MKKENKIKNRLNVGDQVIYVTQYGSVSLTQVDLETVKEIQSENGKKFALLTNNAWVDRNPDVLGNYPKLSKKNLQEEVKSNVIIKRSTPELIILRDAWNARRQIKNFISYLQQNILKNLESKAWDKFTEIDQKRLLILSNNFQEDIKVLDELLKQNN